MTQEEFLREIQERHEIVQVGRINASGDSQSKREQYQNVYYSEGSEQMDEE